MSPLAYCTVWFVIGVLTYPPPHIDHLIQSLQPKEIIADLSNYKSYVNDGDEIINPMALNFMNPHHKERLNSTLKLGCEVFVVG
jgi:ABC-type Fe3+-citrate transport system substrate-binding protein